MKEEVVELASLEDLLKLRQDIGEDLILENENVVKVYNDYIE